VEPWNPGTALWPGESAIGKRVSACGGQRPDTGLEIVGVAADVRATPKAEPPVTVYEPHWRATTTRFHFVVRTQADPRSIPGALVHPSSASGSRSARGRPRSRPWSCVRA
jgi:hypothetical protein